MTLGVRIRTDLIWSILRYGRRRLGALVAYPVSACVSNPSDFWLFAAAAINVTGIFTEQGVGAGITQHLQRYRCGQRTMVKFINDIYLKYTPLTKNLAGWILLK